MSTYDAIVVGTGGAGSAALYHLAQRGLKVLGLDRFAPPHDRGSSHGETRIIRQAYYEHADYVPMLLRAYEHWNALEAKTGEHLFYRTGLLQLGPADGRVIPNVRRSAETHGLAVEALDAAESIARFPTFRCGPEGAGLYEAKGGTLRVEACVVAHLAAAREAGAEWAGDAAASWAIDGEGVVVRGERGEYSAARLVVCAGSWATDLLGPLLRDHEVELEVRRKSLFWFATEAEDLRFDRGCPAFLFEVPEGLFYGFPVFDELGLKVAEHTGGEVVEDPLKVSRSVYPEEEERVRAFLREYIPSAGDRLLQHAVCLYTMTPDEHFVVDRHPEHPQVAFAAGLSGHGFKLTPALGEALADLVTEGRTDVPVGFLGLGRFAGG